MVCGTSSTSRLVLKWGRDEVVYLWTSTPSVSKEVGSVCVVSSRPGSLSSLRCTFPDSRFQSVVEFCLTLVGHSPTPSMGDG